MGEYTREELEEALQIVASTISRCEKAQPKFVEGTSQHTLLRNRLKALYISKSLLLDEHVEVKYTKEELKDALKPVILMILYECWWIRYFKSEKAMKDFYSSFCGVPVAGATLPVAAFFLLGLYGKVVWLMISVIILGIGHIGIHFQHLREIQA